MAGPVSAERYLAAPREQVAAVLDAGLTTGGLGLEPEGPWGSVAWTRTVRAWRRPYRWSHDGARGQGTIDLLDAGEHRTLLVVCLEQGGFWTARVRTADAAQLATEIRNEIGRSQARVGVPMVRGVEPTAIPTPASVAVRYSGA